jgi:hypothetical protein
MVKDLVYGRPVRQEAGTLPQGDYCLVDLVREATGWKQICLEGFEGNMAALVQAFCQDSRAVTRG